MEIKLKYLKGETGLLIKDVKCDFLCSVPESNIHIMTGLLEFMINKSYTEMILEIRDLSEIDDNFFFDRCIYKNYYFEFVINKEKNLIIQNKVNPSLFIPFDEEGSAYTKDGNFKKGYPNIIGIKDLDYIIKAEENKSIFKCYLKDISIIGNFFEKFCAKKLLSVYDKLIEKRDVFESIKSGCLKYHRENDFFLLNFDITKKYELKDVEKLILDKLVSAGYIIGEGNWKFKVEIESFWKEKKLTVMLNDENGVRPIFTTTQASIDEMYMETISYFTKHKIIKTSVGIVFFQPSEDNK